MQASSNVPQSAHRLFIAFLEQYLEIEFVGFQSCFGHGSDLILFRSPRTGTTLAVSCEVMLQPRPVALAIVQSKISESDCKFQLGGAQ